jgi:hypothetical protein
MQEIVKGAAVILVEAGLATIGTHPAILIGVGLVLLGGLYRSQLVLLVKRRKVDQLLLVPTRDEWRDCETRFSLVDGEVEAIWCHYPATGLVKWSVYPRPDYGSARTVQRFLSEASSAGLVLRRMGSPPAKFPVDESTDPVDRWLGAVAAIVDSGTRMHGSGRDEDGDHETGYLHKLVDASKVACASLAADSDAVSLVP